MPNLQRIFNGQSAMKSLFIGLFPVIAGLALRNRPAAMRLADYRKTCACRKIPLILSAHAGRKISKWFFTAEAIELQSIFLQRAACLGFGVIGGSEILQLMDLLCALGINWNHRENGELLLLSLDRELPAICEIMW